MKCVKKKIVTEGQQVKVMRVPNWRAAELVGGGEYEYTAKSAWKAQGRKYGKL